MKKEKTMREIYYELKELRKNPTPDNIDKINKLYRELTDYRDPYEDSLDIFRHTLYYGQLIALISLAVSFLILCIKFIFLT